ncbi:MAG: ABC transporter ATP-binding protein [Actinomycetota bacterium]|nr:ABC transporter ATP-binding protein [Actinomycetota bacterium]
MSNRSAAASEPILVVESVERRFGGLVAVSVDHLVVPRHKITALIGPNGAGKTTLFNVLTGFDHADGGHWKFDGVDVSGWPAYRVARQGMVRTFQLTKALAGLTVLDNMLLGASGQSGERIILAPFRARWRAEERTARERAVALLDDFGLSARQNDLAATMSGGQRKLLEMARALMVEPKLVMLDEPMAGVNPALVQSLLHHVQRLRDEGRTVMFVEHDMDVVMSISDRVICMAEGRVIADGTPAEVVGNQAVIDAYLGQRHARAT